MKLVLAFLADYAVAQSDGTVNAIRAGLDIIAISTFPATVPQLSVALKFEFSATDRERRHDVQIRSLTHRGEPLTPLLGITVPPLARNEQRSGYVPPLPLVYTMRDVLFREPGTCRFLIEAEGQVLAELQLNVVQESPSQTVLGPITTLQTALQAGYLAFRQGNVRQATEIFTDLARRFPDSPDVHNNLGFVLLAQQQFPEALGAFEAASATGYREPEILSANIATCHYFLEQYDAARRAFVDLMTATVRSLPMILLVLGRGSARFIELGSAADFIALMALNAGRCELALGHKALARRFAEVAQMGLVSLRELPGSLSTFRSALQDLADDAAETEAR